MTDKKTAEGQDIELKHENALEAVSGGEMIKLECRDCGTRLTYNQYKNNNGLCDRCKKLRKEQNLSTF